MKVAFTIQHPAHVHLFRHTIDALTPAHDVRCYVRDSTIIRTLLESYGIEHTVVTSTASSPVGLALSQLKYEFGLWRVARAFDPDVILGVGGVSASHVATALGCRSLIFIDSEDHHARSNHLAVPFADIVCTPRAHPNTYGAKHRRYDGYHELAYLHPNRFDPDPDRLEAAGIDPTESYFVVRFSSWEAMHDVGQHGFSLEQKWDLITTLERHGTVYITSENELPPRFRPFYLPTEPADIHHLLSYADLCVADSGTIATEAAVLGTPTVRLSAFDRERELMNFRELSERYDLLVTTSEPTEAINVSTALVRDPATSQRWEENRSRLLAEKIDVTSFILSCIRDAR